MRQVLPLPLVTPGSWGLNTQQSNALLPYQFCTEATNLVFDDAGRLAARKGLNNETTTPMTSTPTIDVLHEYRKADGTVEIISAANNKLWAGVATFTDKTGTTTPAADDWQFMNFEDKCIGVQQGENTVIYTGTGNFAEISPSGTLPTGNCGVSAYGRLWIADNDYTTVKFCGLLDETDWNGTGAGSIDMNLIWGVDTIKGIAAAFNRLIVFGTRNIAVFADALGSTIGLDPANLFVEDLIQGTGLTHRDTIQNIGEGDLWYLSPVGVQSLVRVIQEKNNPLSTICPQVRDYLLGIVDGETGNIRSAHDIKNGHYILTFDSGKQIVINTKGTLEDGSYRVTEWNLPRVRSIVYRANKDLLFGLTLGEIAKYSGTNDLSTDFRIAYKSGWLALGEEAEAFTKILKKWTSTIYVQGSGDLIFTVYKDFENSAAITETISVVADGGSEWGVSEWGLAEWSGGLALREINMNLGRTAQYIQLSVESTLSSTLAIQKFNIISKRGRLNT